MKPRFRGLRLTLVGLLVLLAIEFGVSASRRIFARVRHTGDRDSSPLDLRRHSIDHALPSDLSRGERAMTPRFCRLWLTLAGLLVLLAIEFGMSFLPMGRQIRPLVLIPAALMIGTVATMFMEIGRGPEIVRLFAAAGLLWLAILLGLGSLDPMTRTDYYVQLPSPK